MVKSTDPVIQHYVPQFLLRHFSGAKGQLNVFDKHEQRVFKSNPKGIAAERYFNNFVAGNEKISLEEFLGRVESQVSPIIETLLDTQNLSRLDRNTWDALAYFMAIQSSRTREQREQTKHFLSEFAAVFKKRFDFDVAEEMGVIDAPGEEDNIIANPVANSFFEGIVNAHEFSHYFRDRYWVLGVNESSTPLWTSDNPVVISTMVNADPKPRSVGLAVKGTELHFPLSSEIVLTMYCAETATSLRKQFENALAGYMLSPSLDNAEQIQSIQKAIHDLFITRSIGLNAAAVEHLNSLQVAQSYRYVISPLKDFELVERMLEDSEAYKTGRRIIVQ